MIINNVKLIPATGKINDCFVGLKIVNNEIEFHYPESFHLSDSKNGIRRDVISILRTISLVRKNTGDSSSFYNKSKDSYILPIKSFIWLLNDYLTYGKYINREKVYENGIRGRINWKKTMHSNPAISNGNIVFTSIVSEHKNQKDDLLTEIYFYCVEKAIDSIGWLFNIKFNNEGKDYYKLFDRRKYLRAVNDEMGKTFDDVKRIRLTNMKSIITGLDDSVATSKDLIYGVDSYEYVYEKLIDLMFSSVKNKKEFYPYANWDLKLERKLYKSSYLRPDTVLIDSNNNNVYILDSKYYRYGTTFMPDDLPETSSIQKQVAYGDYIKQMKDKHYENIYNAFIMPYNKEENINKTTLHENLEFIGVANIEDEKEKDKYNKVIGILIDTKFLINNWINRCEQETDKLINMINEYADYINNN